MKRKGSHYSYSMFTDDKLFSYKIRFISFLSLPTVSVKSCKIPHLMATVIRNHHDMYILTLAIPMLESHQLAASS